QVFAEVPDPRDPRGVRHTLPVILTCGAAAVLSGAKSWVAVAEWVADADREALRALGVSAGEVLPSESTIRRTMAVLDADDVDARIGAWMLTRVAQV
ncbi:MAG: transposase family protein, partial [Dermatophilaceae bacterium]